MPQKRILNLTSTKKRNTMLQYANTSTSGGSSVTIGPGPALVNGGSNGFFIFCPTAMDLTDSSGNNHSIVNAAQRTATTCYMRGFAENLRMQTSTGLPWFWRRITFCAKNTIFSTFQSGDTPTQTNSAHTSFVDTSNGLERLWFNQSVNNSPLTQTVIQSVLFKGVSGKDWSDVLTAPVDTARVDLKSDRMKCIRSGNASGTVMEKKFWYPMNKNLVYDDDESGDSEVASYLSVLDKKGMGDYYIVDIFQPGTGATSTDLLQIIGTSSMYWHEK